MRIYNHVSGIAFLPLRCIRLAPGVFHERQETNRQHLCSLDPERLLVGFHRQAGIASNAEPYGGWESKDIAGHSLGHVLSAQAHLYAATGDVLARAMVERLVGGLQACQESATDGYVLPVPKRIFDEVRNGRIEATPFSLNGCWVPFYTLHKVLAGLRDAYRLCASQRALRVASRIGTWLQTVMESLTEEQIQTVLITEHGGMQEVLIDLAEDVRNPAFHALAIRCFHHRALIVPLLAGVDALDGVHGNTLIPKVMGLAKRYDRDADPHLRRAVEWFWSRVVEHRSYCIGGHGDSEHFFDPARFADHLTAYTAETCNSYNLLKLTARLFAWEPRVALIDFAERVLLNHVLANIGRAPGEYGYFLGLGSVATKVFSTPCDSWWCCVGTGMESPTRYAELAYAERDGDLWVNLYQAGRLSWERRQVELLQETRFPDDERIRITVSCVRACTWTLHMRLPGWCAQPQIRINDRVVNGTRSATYHALIRCWADGDVVELHLPMQLTVESLPQAPDIIAFRHGPLVLAGVVPTLAGIPDPACERHRDHLCARGKTDDQPPVLVSEPGTDVCTHFAPQAEASSTYRSLGVIRPLDLQFRPLLHLYEEHYAVYFTKLTPQAWAAQAESLRLAARSAAAEATATVDRIEPGFQQSEVEHAVTWNNSQCGDFRDRKWRSADAGGFFSYVLAIDPDPCVLEVTCWGGEWVACGFVVHINNQPCFKRHLHHDQPGDFFTCSFDLSGLLPSATDDMRITFMALPDMSSGRIFHVRVRRKNSIPCE